jgi:myo-inositol-1(or 4)-monophosphatase
LVHKGKAVLGVIYNPITEDLFQAIIGQGAFRNDSPIHVTERVDLEGCNMLGSAEFLRSKKWKRPWPNMHIDSFNSIALRIAMVAAGEWDSCVALNPKSDWDIAAAEIILNEAGGLATTHTGDALIYNQQKPLHRSIIASGPHLHGHIIDRVKHIPV